LAPDAVDAYVRAFSRPGALRASFDDYRALETDLALDDEDAAAGRRLTMPLLVLWGSVGLPAQLPTLDIWRRYADDVTGTEIPDCGHFIPEERPDVLLTPPAEVPRLSKPLSEFARLRHEEDLSESGSSGGLGEFFGRRHLGQRTTGCDQRAVLA
jgi:pimeloyl-ACP methyl ester carboxylesterase